MINKLTLRDPALLCGCSVTYSPPAVANLAVWYKADTGCTLSGVPCVDNDPVDSWANSGTGAQAATAAGAQRPTYKTGIVNGKPVVRFNGSNQWLDITEAAENDLSLSFTFFAVIYLDVLTPYHMILTKGTGPFTMQWEYRVAPAGLNRFEMGGTFPNLLSSNPAIPATTWTRVSATKDGAGGGVTYVNNVLSHSAGMVCTHVASQCYIGRRADGNYYDGDLAEVGLYNIELSAPQRTGLDNYLKAKYGL